MMSRILVFSVLLCWHSGKRYYYFLLGNLDFTASYLENSLADFDHAISFFIIFKALSNESSKVFCVQFPFKFFSITLFLNELVSLCRKNNRNDEYGCICCAVPVL